MTTLTRLLIIAITLLLLSCNNNEAEPAQELTTTINIMSYNIQHGRGMDGEVNLERIAQVILDEGADIVALQEVDMGVERSGRIMTATKLAELTGLEHYVFGKNIDHQGGEYGIATLSRFPISEYENFQFERLSNEQRGILTTLIDVDGYTLLMLNTHLAHRSQDEPERLNYIAGATNEIIPKYQADGIVFIGDFNDVPGSATHEAVKGFLTDVWEVVGNGAGFTIPPDNPNRRIDYIFYNDGLEPLWAKVSQTMASDHLPLVAEFELIK